MGSPVTARPRTNSNLTRRPGQARRPANYVGSLVTRRPKQHKRMHEEAGPSSEASENPTTKRHTCSKLASFGSENGSMAMSSFSRNVKWQRAWVVAAVTQPRHTARSSWIPQLIADKRQQAIPLQDVAFPIWPSLSSRAGIHIHHTHHGVSRNCLSMGRRRPLCITVACGLHGRALRNRGPTSKCEKTAEQARSLGLKQRD